jgi:hypothetical protein
MTERCRMKKCRQNSLEDQVQILARSDPIPLCLREGSSFVVPPLLQSHRRHVIIHTVEELQSVRHSSRSLPYQVSQDPGTTQHLYQLENVMDSRNVASGLSPLVPPDDPVSLVTLVSHTPTFVLLLFTSERGGLVGFYSLSWGWI